MPGFIFTLRESSENTKRVLQQALLSGAFAYEIQDTKKIGAGALSGTLADFCSVCNGDNIYFFENRKIYGVGVIETSEESPLPAYQNFGCAYLWPANPKNIKESNIPAPREYLMSTQATHGFLTPWLVFFSAYAFDGKENGFFRNGVDMDDVLEYKPESFKALRQLEGRSFIKIDDEENEALKEILLIRENQKEKSGTFRKEELYFPVGKATFNRPGVKELIIKKTSQYRIEPINSIINKKNFGKGIPASGQVDADEALLEAYLVDQIAHDRINWVFKDEKKKRDYCSHWDFVSRQVNASPFKPTQWQDRIDIFAYRFFKGTKAISDIMILELKKGRADSRTITQLMKYVDWVCKKYAYGDYSKILAAVVAKDCSGVTSDSLAGTSRTFIIGSHPGEKVCWEGGISLFEFSKDDQKKTISIVER
jgi:hypothetical protein